VQQQIDLRPFAATPRPRLAPAVMLRALFALVLALCAATVHLALARGRSDAAARMLERRLGERQKELARLAQALESQLDSTRDEARARALEGDRDAMAALLERLADGALGRRIGFSSELRALDVSRVEGVWLTGFALAGGGRELRLSGRTLHAEGAPRLLQRLGATQPFASTQFRELRLSRPEPGAPLAFEVRSHSSPSGEEPQ
jgi:Tfp pilus assembly protein PilN